jgi:surfeit locus 1 family protein
MPKAKSRKKSSVKRKSPAPKQPIQNQPARKAVKPEAKTATVSPFFTLFCLVVFIGLLGLGTWQVKRLVWKNTLEKSVSEQTAALPLLLPKVSDYTKKDLTFRRLIAGGFFLHDQEIVLQGKYLKNKQGAYILTPLLLQDNSIILVNRGWVPKDKTDPATRPESLRNDVQLLNGIGWVFDEPWVFLPNNNPKENLWLWADEQDLMAYLAERNPGRRIYPVIFAQTHVVFGKKEGDLPIVPEKKIRIENDHLQYAITWYVLAIAIAGMYFAYRRSPR